LTLWRGRVWSTGVLVQVTMFHFALVLGLLCKILTQDPGTLDRADSDPRFSCIADLVEKKEKPQRFCPYCEVRRTSPGDIDMAVKYTLTTLVLR